MAKRYLLEGPVAEYPDIVLKMPNPYPKIELQTFTLPVDHMEMF